MDIFELCKQNTIASEAHILNLKKIVEHLNAANTEGSIVECGSGKSGCCMWMAHLQLASSMQRNVYLYDTFDVETYPTLSEMDPAKTCYIRFQENQELTYTDSSDSPVQINQAITNMTHIGYPPALLHFIMGDVCTTLESVRSDEIAILRLDTESYESTKKELEVLFPRVVPGGYIILHYSDRQAVSEFLEENAATVTVLYNEPVPDYVILVKAENATNILE